MTCTGFSNKLMGGCSIAWLIFGLLIIVGMVANRQFNDFGVEWNQWGGYVGAIVPYMIAVAVSGNYKIGLVLGILGMLAGGYFGGRLFGGEY